MIRQTKRRARRGVVMILFTMMMLFVILPVVGLAVDVGVLLAPFLSDGYSLEDADSLSSANRHLATLIAGHPDRLVGLGVVNPLHAQAVAQAIYALDDLGLHGLKMVPSRWVPSDHCAQAVFAVAAQRNKPILFHSGIFIDGRSGRYCRPVEFEAVASKPECHPSPDRVTAGKNLTARSRDTTLWRFQTVAKH